jgi:hypothetical protein
MVNHELAFNRMIKTFMENTFRFIMRCGVAMLAAAIVIVMTGCSNDAAARFPQEETMPSVPVENKSTPETPRISNDPSAVTEKAAEPAQAVEEVPRGKVEVVYFYLPRRCAA